MLSALLVGQVVYSQSMATPEQAEYVRDNLIDRARGLRGTPQSMAAESYPGGARAMANTGKKASSSSSLDSILAVSSIRNAPSNVRVVPAKQSPAQAYDDTDDSIIEPSLKWLFRQTARTIPRY